MEVKQKLAIILSLTGWTQERLAQELHVSFATVNSWVGGKSVPRRGAQERIDSLFASLTGVFQPAEDTLQAKKDIIFQKSLANERLIDRIFSRQDLHDQLVLSFTYHTNGIEGSTLSEPETAAVLFHNSALPNKTLTEQLEAKNHQVAIEYAFEVIKREQQISEQTILKLHGMLMNGIREDAGRYRTHGVRIVGANVPTANPLKVSERMVELVRWIDRSHADPIAHVARIHAAFEQIHPFSDGNGRVGRLLMLLMLLDRNIAPAIVKQKKKQVYYRALQRAQQTEDFQLLEEFLSDAILEGYRILL